MAKIESTISLCFWPKTNGAHPGTAVAVKGRQAQAAALQIKFEIDLLGIVSDGLKVF